MFQFEELKKMFQDAKALSPPPSKQKVGEHARNLKLRDYCTLKMQLFSDEKYNELIWKYIVDSE